MARPSKDWRPAIADAALACFTAAGYRQTQVADVARRLKIAVGTIYTQIDGKAALFDLALRRALDLALEPDPASTATLLRRETGKRARWPLLSAALKRSRAADMHGELSAILGELYDGSMRSRRMIALLDRCAWELPELAVIYARRVKGRYIADITAYVARRAKERALNATDPPATARAAMEAVVWMAMHRHRDAMPPTVDEATARAAVVTLVTGGLLATG